MIRPAAFRLNEETAINNYFQKELQLQQKKITLQAQAEFDLFVKKLQNAKIEVIVFNALQTADTPDAVFPNNWVSFHENGSVVLYPMFAPNRRRERRKDLLNKLQTKGFHISKIIDYSAAEHQNHFLEATGSLVLDRIHKKVYAALSPRTHEELVLKFCNDFDYSPIIFHALQNTKGQRKPIYHTNVMMSIADHYAVICLDCIDNPKERQLVIHHLKEDKKEIIVLREDQLSCFAGNTLQVNGRKQKYLIMSDRAQQSLSLRQRTQITRYNPILSSNLNTIETLGGGSARCMIAGIFLPQSNPD